MSGMAGSRWSPQICAACHIRMSSSQTAFVLAPESEPAPQLRHRVRQLFFAQSAPGGLGFSADSLRRSRSSRVCLFGLEQRRLYIGARQIRSRVKEDTPLNNPDTKCWDLFFERGRSRSGFWPILITVPWTGNTTIDNPAFP